MGSHPRPNARVCPNRLVFSGSDRENTEDNEVDLDMEGSPMAKLEDIEGVGAVYAGKLRDAGVRSIEGLLKAGATPAGRKDLAAKSGISDALILEWVNHADLFRIKGIGEEYSDLLEEAGVDTVVELATRNPTNLHAALTSTNQTKRLVRKLPSETQVAGWIQQAKSLPRAISY
jgi:predicted flap endonuclease-1-like 5' DNA nuclease